MRNIIIPYTDASPLHSSLAYLKWKSLLDILSKKYSIYSNFNDLDNKTIAVILFNHDNVYERELLDLKDRNRIKLIRIVTESPVVNFQYTQEINSLYDFSVLTHQPPVSIDFRHKFHNPPIRSDSINKKLLKTKFYDKASSGRLALVASNYYSISRFENYSARRLFLKELGMQGVEIDIVGKNWNQIKLLSFIKLLREISIVNPINLKLLLAPFFQNINFDKITSLHPRGYLDVEVNQILKDYEFALIIENYLNYVSEKFFVTAEAGSIPVVLGTSTSIDIFPINSFVPILTDKNLVLQFTALIHNEDFINLTRENLINYLTDLENRKYTYKFESENITKSICEFMGDF